MNTIIFEKDERVKQLSLDALKATCLLSDFDGRLPKSRPIEHHELIQRVGTILNTKNQLWELEPITVSRSDSSRITKLDPENLGLPESWVFRRLVTRMRLINPMEEISPSIGIGYNENGIALAWGLNVHVCQNMNIMGGKCMTSYTQHSHDSVPYEIMMEMFASWVDKQEELAEHDIRSLRNMMEIQLPGGSVENLVGKLQLAAVAKYEMKRNDLAPLNISQCSDFSRKLLQTGKYFEEDSTTSLYDLLQIGTNVLTHNEHNIDYKWQAVNNMTRFIEQEIGGIENN